MKPEFLIIHCSATKDSGTVSLQTIRRYHMGYAYKGLIISAERAQRLIEAGEYVKRPWSDIGYHAGIELVNDEYEFILGRPFDRMGAHCKAGGMNRQALGVCFVGDYDDNPPPPDMLELGARHCAALCKLLNIPVENILGHCQLEPKKTCPGKAFDMDAFRGLVAEYINK